MMYLNRNLLHVKVWDCYFTITHICSWSCRKRRWLTRDSPVNTVLLMSGNLLAGVLCEKKSHTLFYYSSRIIWLKSCMKTTYHFLWLTGDTAASDSLSWRSWKKKKSQFPAIIWTVSISGCVQAPVCWCAPLWKKCIHGFQIPRAKLEQEKQAIKHKNPVKVKQRSFSFHSNLTVFCLQQLLEILLCLLLHYRLAGTDVCERTMITHYFKYATTAVICSEPL